MLDLLHFLHPNGQLPIFLSSSTNTFLGKVKIKTACLTAAWCLSLPRLWFNRWLMPLLVMLIMLNDMYVYRARLVLDIFMFAHCISTFDSWIHTDIDKFQLADTVDIREIFLNYWILRFRDVLLKSGVSNPANFTDFGEGWESSNCCDL